MAIVCRVAKATNHQPPPNAPPFGRRQKATKTKEERQKKVEGKLFFPAVWFRFGVEFPCEAQKPPNSDFFTFFPEHTHTHSWKRRWFWPKCACVWALAASRASACRLLELFLLPWPRVQVPQPQTQSTPDQPTHFPFSKETLMAQILKSFDYNRT